MRATVSRDCPASPTLMSFQARQHPSRRSWNLVHTVFHTSSICRVNFNLCFSPLCRSTTCEHAWCGEGLLHAACWDSLFSRESHSLQAKIHQGWDHSGRGEALPVSLPGFDKHPVTFYFVRFDVVLINCCIKKEKHWGHSLHLLGHSSVKH